MQCMNTTGKIACINGSMVVIQRSNRGHYQNVTDCQEQENTTFADLSNNDPLSIYAFMLAAY